MAIRRMAIDTNFSSYAEIKERHVIATGWPKLGDLSCLYQLCRLKFLDRVQAYNMLTIWALEIKEEGYNPLKTIFRNSFNRLLFDIEPGDIVIGYEGTKVCGICQICNCFTYAYDYDGLISCVSPSAFHKPKTPKFEYAHCLYGVEWVDWDTFNKFVIAASGTPIPDAASGHGVKGIDGRNDNADRIQLGSF